MISINETKLAAIVESALASVRGNKRWTNAILRAEQVLTSGNPYIHFNGSSLLMLSESGEIYEANGVCQCKAYRGGQPCRHRAAYKLFKHYMEDDINILSR
jgi:hypothetical protein